jgi:hypothetical protein
MMHDTFGAKGPPAVALRPPFPVLLAVFVATLIAMIASVATFHRTGSAIAAATFALILIASVIWTQSPLWNRQSRDVRFSQRDALLQSATLIMLAFFWCALAFYAIYLGTNIHWQHGWEYGSGFLLITAGYGLYLRSLSDPEGAASQPHAIEHAIRFSAAQAVLVAIGLIYIIGSGKLASVRGDWPANQVFLAGGFAIMSISVILLKTCASLSERAAQTSSDQR